MAKIFKFSVLYLLALGLTFLTTSCDEDSLQEETLTNIVTQDDLPELVEASLLPPPTDPNNPEPEAMRTPCFRFVYPISLVVRTGEVLTADTPEELREHVQTVRSEGLRANFQYPFDVELANGETATISFFLQFRRLRNFCAARDNVFDEPCFRYNYPIEVTIGQNTVSIGGPLAWRRALRAAVRGANVSINYPITVTLAGEDEPLTINNRQEHNELRLSCGDGEGPCFRFVYPLDLIVDEETVSVASRAEWRATIIANGREDVRPAYPLDIRLSATEEIITVSENTGWAAVRELCE